MGRRHQKKIDDNFLIIIFATLAGLAVFGGIAGGASELNFNFRLIIFIAASIMIVFFVAAIGYLVYQLLTRRDRSKSFAALRAHKVDDMTGTEFEIFLKHLLTARGFKVKNVWHGNDGGVDLVARLDDKVYSIQAKRYNNRHKADRRAITDAVAGITFRDCTHAMAITNSYFTKAATEYANKTGCELIDRDALAKWIYELKGGA